MGAEEKEEGEETRKLSVGMAVKEFKGEDAVATVMTGEGVGEGFLESYPR